MINYFCLVVPKMKLENKIPPPIIALITGIIISASSAIVTPFHIYGIKFIAILLIACSFLIIILSIKKFKKENTTINPMDPNQTIKLVASGIFAISRNPMYLGLAGILIGIALFLQAWLGFVAVPIFIMYINKYQIAPEEKILKQKFKEEYIDYCKKVKRWI